MIRVVHLDDVSQQNKQSYPSGQLVGLQVDGDAHRPTFAEDEYAGVYPAGIGEEAVFTERVHIGVAEDDYVVVHALRLVIEQLPQLF